MRTTASLGVAALVGLLAGCGMETQDSAVAGGEAAALTTTTYQAENATLYHATVSSEWSGFTGPGYVDYTNETASYVDFTVNVATAGTSTVVLRYANGTTQNRTMDLSVNGALAVSGVSFPGTGAWTSWATRSVSLVLRAGTNTIRVKSATSNGGPNLDRIDVTEPAGPVQTCTLTIAVSGNGTTSPAPGTYVYDAGSSVTVTALPSSGATFTGWSGAAGGTANPVSITLSSSQTLTASFSGGGSSGGTPSFAQIGFATQNGGTTGGTGGTEVTVSTLAALRQYAGASGKYIVKIPTTITGSGTDAVTVSSDKTIVGVGASGVLVGIGLHLDTANLRNVIIRNLKITKVLATDDNDAIHIKGDQGPVRNIWVDHCDLSAVDPAVQSNKDLYDGLLDVTRDAAYVTVSWTFFHDHWKSSLVGASDTDNYDRRITYHHNYFYNVNSRLPSYRFGQGHVFNNYYEKVGSSGVNSRMGARLRVEGNSFNGVKDPITSQDSDSVGYWDVGGGNTFVSCSGSQPTSSNTSYAPPYSYSSVVTPTASVPTVVKTYAGIGKLGSTPWLF